MTSALCLSSWQNGIVLWLEFDYIDVLCVQQFNFQLLLVVRKQTSTTLKEKRVVLSVCEAQLWQLFFTAEFVRNWAGFGHYQSHLVDTAPHAVEVSKVKVWGHLQQYPRWNLKANGAEVGVPWWNAILVLGHEEQTIDIAIDRWCWVATVILPVNLHYATTFLQDVVEVLLWSVAVQPVTFHAGRLAAIADGGTMQFLQIAHRQLCAVATKINISDQYVKNL